MRCPACSAETKVTDSRPLSDSQRIRRTRKCKGCGGNFKTVEKAMLPQVTDASGETGDFDILRVSRDLVWAFEGLPDTAPELESGWQELQHLLFRECLQKSIDHVKLASLVIEALEQVNDIAAKRYAAKYFHLDAGAARQPKKAQKTRAMQRDLFPDNNFGNGGDKS